MNFRLIAAGAGALALLAGTLPASAQAAGVSDFYKSKNVTLLIGYPPGGGYDAYGRTVGRYIGGHIPGHPTVIVQNMPGAGSLKSANYLYNVAPKDGSVFGIFAGGIAMDALIGGKKTEFDPRKFNWLGSATESSSACYAWHGTGFKTLKDVMKRQMIVGASSGGSSTYAWPKVLNSVLGTKFKVIPGYPGSKAIILAMEKGEVQGLCGYFISSIESVRPTWIPEHKVNILVQEATTRNPQFPNIPTVFEYAKTDKQKQILNLVYGWQVMGRPFTAPPGVPADRVEALRTAFMATMHDKNFLADAKKEHLKIAPRTAKQVLAYLDKAWKTPKSVVHATFVALGRQKAGMKEKK